jgi:predicted P-loop ATPase
MTILEGAQGDGKSEGIQALVGEDFYGDNEVLRASGPKQLMEKTAGKVVIEAGDLSGLSKGDIDSIKTLITARSDQDRMAYERYAEDRKRGFTLIGTTNRSIYLKDETGNRRFDPMRVAGSSRLPPPCVNLLDKTAPMICTDCGWEDRRHHP